MFIAPINFYMKNIFLVLFSLLISFAVIELKPVDSDNAVTFVIKNFGINTKGELKGLKGTIKWDSDNPSNSSFNVSVEVATVNTGIEMRDNDLKKESYFDVEKYPTIQLVSTKITNDSVMGNLTIKNTTKQIGFPYSVTELPGGHLFEGSFSINRRDFGVGGGSFTLSENVEVTLKVKAYP